jgi:hypothetical protein
MRLPTARIRETRGTTRRIGDAEAQAYFVRMSRPYPASAQQDPLRATFLCLIVLAQLLLPSMFERARAAEDVGCVGADSTVQAGKASKPSTHAHAQECAHCRPQMVVLGAPTAHPEIAVAPAFETTAQHGARAMIEAALQALPPPTGPPAVSVSV